jgi:hypothetical protein
MQYSHGVRTLMPPRSAYAVTQLSQRTTEPMECFFGRLPAIRWPRPRRADALSARGPARHPSEGDSRDGASR